MDPIANLVFRIPDNLIQLFYVLAFTLLVRFFVG